MPTFVHDPGNYLEKITEVFVFASVDKHGEGIVGQTLTIDGQNVFMPFLCSDVIRMESIKPIAKEMARITGKKIKLIKLTQREELEEF